VFQSGSQDNKWLREPMKEQREAKQQIVSFLKTEPGNICKKSRGTCDPRLYRLDFRPFFRRELSAR
jgi:hypothetical protein